MAVRFDTTAGKRLSRTTGVLDYNAAYTVDLWVYFPALPAGYHSIITIGSNGAVGIDVLQLNGSQLLLYVQNVASSEISGSTLSTATWYHLTVVRESATSVKVYLNETLDITNTLDITARTASTTMAVGATFYNSVYSEEVDARVANTKIWSAALTAAEFAQERNLIRLARTANLLSWSPHFPGSGERARDYSGNGYNWTEGGTLTDEDGPPVSWGAPATILHPPPTAVSRLLPQMTIIQTGLPIRQLRI